MDRRSVDRQQLHRRQRRGYALLMCLLAIAVSSCLVITTFQIQRVHVAEASARRQLAVIDGLQQAAREHALAVLIDQPAFRGVLGPFSHSAAPSRSYQLQILDSGTGVLVSAVVYADGQSNQATTIFNQAAIDARRTELGL